MDKSAIEQIQKDQQIIHANDAISSQSIAALPKDFEIHNLEKFEITRRRFRGSMSTNSLDAFAAYAQNNTTSECACFINADEMNATLIFNIGNEENPGHCDHTAKIALEKTAAYRALVGVLDKPCSQKEIAEFIEDWRDYITAWGAEDENGERACIPLPRALHAIRKITIESKQAQESETRTFGASASSMESIDLRGDQLPPEILEFICNPYADLKDRTFELRVGVLTENKNFPVLKLRMIRQEEQSEQMAKEFEQLINDKTKLIEPAVKTYIGNFAA